MTSPPPDEDPDGRPTARMGGTMIVAAWVLVLGLLTLAFSGWLESERNPNRQLRTQMDPGGGRQVALERNRYGHYVATGRVNGQAVEFLLDTGASDVSVPGALADELGLARGARRTYTTAGGPVVAYATELERVELGGIVLRDVRASINPRFESDAILLGMSFLKHLELTQRGTTLTLRQPAPAP
ncbi:MAG: TIGR02281 family clan AA aspartic protease [Gammaproteobacteria bacterium]|nr:TIGR02281 family clan AA aspartic protease [Gammaproteobacteria bacterium]